MKLSDTAFGAVWLARAPPGRGIEEELLGAPWLNPCSRHDQRGCQTDRIVLWVIAGIMILQSLGVSVSGLLAFGGVGGIAVGFAARDLLANFLGGLSIFLDRPFAVGTGFDRRIED